VTDTFSVENGYISLPFVTSPNTLLQQALAAIQAQVPGWTPRESHIEVLLLEQFAQMTAESAQVAANVPLAIFTYFGSLVNILPETGSAAEAQTTWTMIDNKGYTIPAGTVVGYQFSGNSVYLFQTLNDFSVPPGSTATAAGSVVIEAQVAGAAMNGFGPQGLLLIAPTYPFVSSIVSTSTSSGGADPETQAQYLNRLSDQLQLMAPRPILPQDFAALSVNVTGVARAVAVDLLNPGRAIPFAQLTLNEPTIVAGAANFSFDDIGRTVAAEDVPGNAVIESIQSTAEATMNVNATATIANLVTLGDLTDAERCVSVCPVDEDGNELSTAIQQQLQAYLEAQREINFVVNIIDPTYTPINVSWVVTATAGSDADTVQAAIITNLSFFLSQANWGGGELSPPVWDPNENIVRYLSVAAIISDTAGVDYISSLAIGPQGGIMGEADVTIPGYAPLTMVGTLTGSVNINAS
jgi:uncharacterized phage protein gp47/JayE